MAPGAFDLVQRLGAADGIAAHPFYRHLLAPHASARDLGDTVHALCEIHGDRPDLIEIVAASIEPSSAAAWLAQAAAGFAAERNALVQLAAAAGPVPSTPGQPQTAAALTAERHSLEMLARSERLGVGLGAAAALMIDWIAIRDVLDHAAERFGVTLVANSLPTPAQGAMAIDTSLAAERAIAFGAQQLFAQHRGLFCLLDARASARAR